MIIGVLCRRVARLRCGAVKFDFGGKADFPGGMEAQRIWLWRMRDDGGVWSAWDAGWSR